MQVEAQAHSAIRWPVVNPPIAITILGAALAALLLAPHFFTLGNLGNLLRQVALTGIIACGMTVVLLAGGFDLSVGGMAALAGVIAIQIAPHSLTAAIGLSILAGGIAGFINGFLITSFAINPLIVTLGTRYLLYAGANLATSGFMQINRRPEFVLKGTAPPAIFLGLAALLYLVVKYSTWGARVYAVGSDERAAAFSGIHTYRIRVQTYVLCSACASLAGVVLALRSGAAAPDAGSGYELEAIAAAVVGGVSMFGGAGNLLNTVAGVLLLGFLSNVLVLALPTVRNAEDCHWRGNCDRGRIGSPPPSGGSMRPRLWVMLIVLVSILSALEKGFYRPENLLNILLQVSIDGILACGMTLVVLTSGLDLSIGSVMALCGVIFVIAAPYGVWASGLLAGAAGLAVGTLNGFLISRLSLNSLIVTLGTMAVVQGLVLRLSRGYPLPGPGGDFEIPGGGFFLYILLPIVCFGFVAAACTILLRSTQWGRNIYAVGGNRGAARIAQIPIMFSEWSVYVMSAGLAAFAGIVLASRLNTGSPIVGQDAPLQAFVAVTLGGTSLSGGRGGIPQTVLGILILGVLSNGLNVLNVPPALQWGIKGSLLIAFAALDSSPRLGWLGAAKEMA